MISCGCIQHCSVLIMETISFRNSIKLANFQIMGNGLPDRLFFLIFILLIQQQNSRSRGKAGQAGQALQQLHRTPAVSAKARAVEQRQGDRLLGVPLCDQLSPFGLKRERNVRVFKEENEGHTNVGRWLFSMFFHSMNKYL